MRPDNHVRVLVQPEIQKNAVAALLGAGCALLFVYLAVLACIVGVIALVVKAVFGM